MSDWLTQFKDRRVLGLLVILVLFCALDFVYRVVPPAESSDSLSIGAEEDYAFQPVEPSQRSQTVVNWLQQLSTEANEAPEEAIEETKPELIAEGVNLGNKRVRVRAIFIANEADQQVALVEAQDIEARDIEFNEVRQGDDFNGFAVAQVRVNEVEFLSSSGESIVVEVFE